MAALAAALLGAGSARADCPGAFDTKLIPLPIYATLPNEGSTWGAMPVFLRICPETQRTESIVAPSISWNDVIHLTTTARWFHYPSDIEALTLVASASTRINWNFLLIWSRLPTEPGRVTDEVTARLQRSAFFRFFGTGPDAPPSAETSYTGLRNYLVLRRGYNLAHHLNDGACVGFERDDVEDRGVQGLPLSPDVFPDAPGMHGATTLQQGIDVRYDDRRGGDYAERGVRIDAGATVIEGLADSPTFLRGDFQARLVVPEWDGLSGAARLAWTGVTSGRAPFYRQSSLGGAFLLRGFTEDRFIDRQSWTLEFEQRLRLFQTRLFGVVADWRVDPFVATGQVFGPFGEAFSRPQVAYGVGFRAFVHPNVLGRVDVAKGLGEDLNIYVELGYPY
jgi:hypothetical protein